MRTIVEDKIVEIELKKSKFIAYSYKVNTELQIDEI